MSAIDTNPNIKRKITKHW